MAYENAASFFQDLNGRVTGDADAQASLKEIGATYLFKVNGDDGGAWTLNLSELTLTEGEGDADCTVTMEAEDFMAMVNGEANGQQLFMMGKLMIEGDMTLALRLEQVFSAGA